MGQKTGAHRIFVGKLGRVKYRWDNDDYNGDGGGDANNRKDLQKRNRVGKCGMDSSISGQQSVVDIYQYDNEFIRCGYFLN